MIIVRSPLRISLGGGGTDLPSYYKLYGGELTSIAINKYVYICIHDHIKEECIIKYSENEKIKSISKIKHNIIRETIKKYDFDFKFKEITSFADIPAGTGLGSSGAFTVSLVSAIKKKIGKKQTKKNNAEDACDIEINRLKQPCGKQDQYISSYGGIKNFLFQKDGSVLLKKHRIKSSFIDYFLNNSLLIFTGFTRESKSLLKQQKKETETNNKDMIEKLHFTKSLGHEIKKSFEKEDLKEISILMNDHWQSKMKRSKGMSNLRINNLYEHLMKNGCIGGKLIGAGGGGYLLMLCKNKKKALNELNYKGYHNTTCSLDNEGTKIINF